SIQALAPGIAPLLGRLSPQELALSHARWATPHGCQFRAESLLYKRKAGIAKPCGIHGLRATPLRPIFLRPESILYTIQRLLGHGHMCRGFPSR
ncbi:MAG: hypothetical protein L0Y67_05230, partial [Gammaproteobacteria bacterium]|nr:hypothetical protein [Gammaproteobacteria bacterium]